METLQDNVLENWVLDHAMAGQMKLYFAINGDVPVKDNEGHAIYYEIPVRGKRVCVLHPDYLTRVAQFCYEAGIQMIQVIL